MLLQKFGHKSTTQHKTFTGATVEADINAFCITLAEDETKTIHVTQVVYLTASFAYVVYSVIEVNTAFDPTETF